MPQIQGVVTNMYNISVNPKWCVNHQRVRKTHVSAGLNQLLCVRSKFCILQPKHIRQASIAACFVITPTLGKGGKRSMPVGIDGKFTRAHSNTALKINQKFAETFTHMPVWTITPYSYITCMVSKPAHQPNALSSINILICSQTWSTYPSALT